jgi:hypothetical protein
MPVPLPLKKLAHTSEKPIASKALVAPASCRLSRAQPYDCRPYYLVRTLMFCGCVTMYGDPATGLWLVGVTVNTNNFPPDWLMA